MERRKRGNRVDVDNDAYMTSLIYSQNISNIFDVKLGYTYKHTAYREENPTFAKKREDKANTFDLALSKKINKEKTISLKLTKIDNDSNIELYSYKKTTALFTFTKSF